MADFSRQIATARRLIAKNGELCQFYRSTSDIADPTKPWIATDDTGPANDVYILWNYPGFRSAYPLSRTDISDTDASSLVGLMALQENGFTPQINDQLLRSSNEAEIWTVKSVDYVQPDGTKILTEITFVR